MKKFNDIITETFTYSDKILDILNKYNIDIIIKEDGFLTNMKDILNDEKDLKEFRIQLIDKDDEYKFVNVKFSVFLPKNVKYYNKDSKKYKYFVAACLTQALIYFKILNKIVFNIINTKIIIHFNNMTNYSTPNTAFSFLLYHTTELSNFCDVHNEIITNRNLDRITVVDHRLYKDSKFFYHKKVSLDDVQYDNLISDLLKI